MNKTTNMNSLNVALGFIVLIAAIQSINNAQCSGTLLVQDCDAEIK